jgi:nucleoside-diphosphate-sugar epimerase
MDPDHPQSITDELALDEVLSRPTPALVSLMERLEGDILVLGIGGKMGVTLGLAAARAIREAGCRKEVIGVSRFSDSRTRRALEDGGVRTLPCDLLDSRAVAALPQVRNVVHMVGRKFGTAEQESVTWATNVGAPWAVGDHFRGSRMVVFSTGCVYPMVAPATGGCVEATPPSPVGEYAQSCLGRERIFEYWSRVHGTPMCLLRLNYAVDLRYGVLHDIGQRVYAGEPVDLSVSHVNVIWQADANRQALLALELCTSPPAALNVTGPETVSVRFIAEAFATCFGSGAHFTGEGGEGRMYLSNAARAAATFGYPTVPLLTMIHWQADWIARGQPSLGKPTHYGVTDGQF